jgi:hypothetical protein
MGRDLAGQGRIQALLGRQQLFERLHCRSKPSLAALLRGGQAAPSQIVDGTGLGDPIVQVPHCWTGAAKGGGGGGA